MPGLGDAGQFLFFRSAGTHLPVHLKGEVQQQIDDVKEQIRRDPTGFYRLRKP